MNSRRCILLSLALCAIVAFGKSSCVRYYSNPLRTDDRKAIGVGDPYVYRYKGTYYLTGTAAIPDGQGFPVIRPGTWSRGLTGGTFIKNLTAISEALPSGPRR